MNEEAPQYWRQRLMGVTQLNKTLPVSIFLINY